MPGEAVLVLRSGLPPPTRNASPPQSAQHVTPTRAPAHSLSALHPQVSVFDAFSPVVSYERPKKGSRTQIAARLLTLALAGGVLYVLYTHTPDAEKLAASAKEAHDSILDYLVGHWVQLGGSVGLGGWAGSVGGRLRSLGGKVAGAHDGILDCLVGARLGRCSWSGVG